MSAVSTPIKPRNGPSGPSPGPFQTATNSWYSSAATTHTAKRSGTSQRNVTSATASTFLARKPIPACMSPAPRPWFPARSAKASPASSSRQRLWAYPSFRPTHRKASGRLWTASTTIRHRCMATITLPTAQSPRTTCPKPKTSVSSPPQ